MRETSAYMQIALQIRERIVSGELRVGSHLPVIGDLRREFCCSRRTIAKALSVLDKDGWIARYAGRGWYVKNHLPEPTRNAARPDSRSDLAAGNQGELIMDDPRIFVYVANQIRRRITSGEFTPGKPLPLIDEFCQQYACSRQSAGRALKMLESTGWVVRWRGKGYFVEDPLPQLEVAHMEGVAETLVTGPTVETQH
jgi:DNA-binding GntR family transcriptional regulator